MQSAIVKSTEISADVQQGKAVPKTFKKPCFAYDKDLRSLLFESEFPITEADLSTTTETALDDAASRNIKKTVKVLVVKPMVDNSRIGGVLKKILIRYKVKDTSKSLIIAYGDAGTLAGSISFQSTKF